MKRATPTRAVVFDLDGTLLDTLSVVLEALRHALEPFAAVVCGDDLPTHKPEPEGLRDILRRLQVTPAETLLVGDADVDVLGGVSCGVDTLLIHQGREIEATLARRCWHSVTTPQEAFEVVFNLLPAPGITP